MEKEDTISKSKLFILLKSLRAFEGDSAQTGNIITEFETIICLGLAKSHFAHERILLGELAKTALLYFAGRKLFNGGHDKLKSCISNPALCLYYLNHPNRSLRFWKIRNALEQTENLNANDKSLMFNCLDKIQRFT